MTALFLRSGSQRALIVNIVTELEKARIASRIFLARQGRGVSYAGACERRQRSMAQNSRVDMYVFSCSVTI